MDVSLISIDDAISLLEMYGEPVPNDPDAVYAAAYDLLEQLSPDDPLPVAIEDLYVAQDLTNIIEHVPIITLSDILFSSEDDLIDLATDLGLPEVDKERIIRILGYLGKLNNDVNVIDTLPLEIIEEIAVNLDCKSLSILCKVSKKFNSICNNTHVLRRIIQNKGYGGNLKQLDVKALKVLCTVMESGKFVPREAYVTDTNYGTMIKILDNIVQVSVGDGFYLFLTKDGQVYGLGSNKHGELGLSEFKDYPEPQLIPGLDNIREVSAGDSHSLCLSFAGQVYGFGNGVSGQFGQLMLNPDNNIPKRIADLDNIKQISSGFDYSLCLTEDGQVYSFGYNRFGQLGLGHKISSYKPQLIPELKNIKQVSANVHHSLCLTEDGHVYGFGSNWYGESGSEDLNLILKAKLIPKLENIIQVASGGMHSLFLRDDGRLYVTGSNIDGRLGLEIKHDVISRPTLVPKPKNIVQVSAGSFESVFLTQDGKLYIYGRTRNFVRDLNDVVKRQEPVVYADTKALNNVISAGYGYTSNTLVLI